MNYLCLWWKWTIFSFEGKEVANGGLEWINFQKSELHRLLETSSARGSTSREHLWSHPPTYAHTHTRRTSRVTHSPALRGVATCLMTPLSDTETLPGRASHRFAAFSSGTRFSRHIWLVGFAPSNKKTTRPLRATFQNLFQAWHFTSPCKGIKMPKMFHSFRRHNLFNEKWVV